MRAFGNVGTDERLEAVSASRLEGWIEDLTVRAEGDSVRAGELLYRVYSPELIAAQKDYVASLKIGNDNRIAAVRQRLRSVGMQPTSIERLTESKEVIERVPIYAEASGTVSRLEVREGDYVKPGTPVMRLQSYTDVWVIASIPEADLPLIEDGQSVAWISRARRLSPPRGTWTTSIPPLTPRLARPTCASSWTMPPATCVRRLRRHSIRTRFRGAAPVRPERGDPAGQPRGPRHCLPGGGRFAGRAIEIGQSANGRTAILNGLSQGEQVVTSGQFLLDSEVSLRGGLARLEAPPPILAGPETPLSELAVDAATLAEINHFVDMALYFHEALIDDYAIDPYYLDPALRLGDSLKERFANTRLVPILENAQEALRSAKESGSGEALAGDLATLMSRLEAWLLEGAPAHYDTAGLHLFLEHETGRLWLQEGSAPANPYSSNTADTVEWPDLMTGMEAADTRMQPQPGDPHAGHMH